MFNKSNPNQAPSTVTLSRDNIKMSLEDIGYEDVNRTHQPQDRNQ
jgi:hypothetical protein